MEKEELIRVRTALKGGKNLPLVINLDNVSAIIDERKTTEFVLWDDDRETLYLFRLCDMIQVQNNSNITQAISLFAVDYTSVQSLEVPELPLSDLPGVIQTIRATGKTIAPELEQRIVKTYTDLLKNNRAELSREEINKLTGSNLNTKDDYYGYGNKFANDDHE